MSKARADGLDDSFREAGADICSLVVYRWGPAPDPDAVRAAVHAVARRECDAVTFTAAPGAAAFLQAACDEGVLAPVVAATTLFEVGALVVGGRLAGATATLPLGTWAWYAAATGLALGAAFLFTMVGAHATADPIAVVWQFLATIILFPFAHLLIDRFEDADVRFR